MTDMVQLGNADGLYNALSRCYVSEVEFGYKFTIQIFANKERERRAVKLPAAPQKKERRSRSHSLFEKGAALGSGAH